MALARPSATLSAGAAAATAEAPLGGAMEEAVAATADNHPVTLQR